MSGTEIAALKGALGARTELELAAKLGIARSTISQWKRRGGVPDRYLALLDAGSAGSDANAAQHQVFRRLEAHYWLRAALALLPNEGVSGQGVLKAGRAREQLVIALMGLAIRVARTDLKRQVLRDEAEWDALMERLFSAHFDAVMAILLEHGAAPSPDVLNRVLNPGD